MPGLLDTRRNPCGHVQPFSLEQSENASLPNNFPAQNCAWLRHRQGSANERLQPGLPGPLRAWRKPSRLPGIDDWGFPRGPFVAGERERQRHRP